jgi:hypothetical protein
MLRRRDKGRRYDFADLAVALPCTVGIAIACLYLVLLPVKPSLFGSRDFTVYWATGQQLVQHANPYDGDALARLEHGAGFHGAVLFMRNPPWGLLLAMPLGLGGGRR